MLGTQNLFGKYKVVNSIPGTKYKNKNKEQTKNKKICTT